MSVKRTVASTRSGSGGRVELRHEACDLPSGDLVDVVVHPREDSLELGQLEELGAAASARRRTQRRSRSFVLWKINVGTRTAGSTSLTSASINIR